MSSVCVTGASGFVGQNLSAYLENTGFDIATLDLHGSYYNKVFDKVGAVIHLAGKAHDLKNASNPDAYYAVNTELTKKVFDGFLESQASTFITISSVKAIRDSLGGDILTEEVEAFPQTHYGKSKLMAEQYVFNRSIPAGKRVYILRPCMIHGPGNKGNLNLLYQVAKFGIPYPLATFENRRSFVSVENLCFIIKELIERDDIPSGIYNVADDVPLSTNRVIEIMSSTINKKPKLWKINKRLIKAIARVGDFLPIPLNSERLQKLTENYVVSNAKIKRAMGKELPVSSEEGLIKTVESFYKHDK